MSGSMQAIKILPNNKAAVETVPVPTLASYPSYILVKTHAVGLNPVDAKFIDAFGAAGSTLGSDVAGEIVEIGSDVAGPLKIGDRVGAIVHAGNGSNLESGAFADFTRVKADLAMVLPHGVGYEEGATLGVAIVTVGQALVQHLGLEWPGEVKRKESGERKKLLIYGASSGMGLYALKFAKLMNVEIYTTASPHNFDLVKSLGADHVYDYKSPTVGADIRRDTNNSLFLVFDCISGGSSLRISAEALSSKSRGPNGELPTHHSLIVNQQVPRTDVKETYALAFTGIGETFAYKGGQEFRANAEDAKFAKKWIQVVQRLLNEKKLVPLQPEVRRGGLKKVLDEGMEDLRNERVSGKKIVYLID